MSSNEGLRAKASAFLVDPANLSLLQRVSDVVDKHEKFQREAMQEANYNFEREAILRGEEEQRGSDVCNREVEELQLHDDEGAAVNRKRRHRQNEAAKLEAIQWAKKISVNSAAKKFDVSRGRIRNGRRKIMTSSNKRMDGWIVDGRHFKRRFSKGSNR